MESSNSAHARTNARERLPDIPATGINNLASPNPFAKAKSGPRLSTTLPPLIFGTATFNYQFNVDPYALHPTHVVHAALHQGIRAFDTSPYYGPAETILGDALTDSLITTDPVLKNLKRSDYFILTKAGRIASDEFDYSAEWIRYSVQRSCKRLHTTYLDVVYLHDVEFVSPEEVLTGIRELRNLRHDGMVRYVGICGYPVDVLCELTEMILKETGEPLDIVQSYANSTVQNQQLHTRGLVRLINAGVDVVPNASPLGMGLCRAQGPPVGAMGNWHPAPDELKERCARATEWVQKAHGEKLETIAVRFAMENWTNVGQTVGSCGVFPSDAVRKLKGENVEEKENARIGVNVMGVSKITELEETMTVYNNIIKAKDDLADDRRQQVCGMVNYIRENILGSEWADYAWQSPEPGFKNARKEFGVPAAEREWLNLKEVEKLVVSEQSDQAHPDSVVDMKVRTHVGVKEVALPATT